MPITSLGISLSICFVGALISQIFIVPLADRYGRKLILEVCLVIMTTTSFFSVTITSFFTIHFSILSISIFIFIGWFQAFTFYDTQNKADGPHVIGSICFWRFFLGVGVGGIYPISAVIMAEYSPTALRGCYLVLVSASQGNFL